MLEKLAKLSLSYNKDGATWFEGTKVGRNADRVLIKKTGEPTYRLPDIAYHADKVDRGFDLIVDIFGLKVDKFLKKFLLKMFFFFCFF